MEKTAITRLILAEFQRDKSIRDAIDVLEEVTNLKREELRDMITSARNLELLYQPGRPEVYCITPAGKKYLSVV